MKNYSSAETPTKSLEDLNPKTRLIIQLLAEWLPYSEIVEECAIKWIDATNKQISDLKSYHSKLIEYVRGREGIEELNAALKSNDDWFSVDWEDYVFVMSKTDVETGAVEPKTIRLPIKLIDNILSDFSAHGANLTQKQLLRKYQLDPHVWNVIKWRFGMYKLSNVYTDYSVQSASDPVKMIEERVDETLDEKYRRANDIEAIYNKRFDKKAEKGLAMMYFVDTLVDHINQKLEIKPLKVERKTITGEVNEDGTYPVYISSDYHFGEFDDELLEKRLDEMFNQMVADKSDVIRWFSMWDYAETLVEEWMHAGQTLRMKTFGIDLINLIVNVFAIRIKQVLDSGKTLVVEWQGWNHDRTWKTNDQDRQRTYALIIGEMIKLYLKNYIEDGCLIFNNEKTPINRMVIEEVKTVFIGNHWDWAWAKKNTFELISLYGNGQDYYNIIIEGDKHHFSVKQDTNCLRIITSSVKSGWEYATTWIYKWAEPRHSINSKQGLPGYTKVTFNKSTNPKVELITFEE